MYIIVFLGHFKFRMAISSGVTGNWGQVGHASQEVVHNVCYLALWLSHLTVTGTSLGSPTCLRQDCLASLHVFR